MKIKLMIVFLLLFNAVLQAQTVTYRYDNLNRLTRIEYSDGQVIQFTYDAVGNRIAHVVTTSGQQAPVINSFQPQSGPVSTEVTITGDNFTGTTQVVFNGVTSTYTVDSDTQIRATVPQTATTGRITVTTPNGIATSSSDFTVTTTGSPILRTPIYPIVFGTVDVGSSSEQSTTIYNDGSGTLSISDVTKTYGVDDYTVITSFPLNIGPNSSESITVRFSPTSFGSKTETFKLINNDPNNQNAQFNVAGHGGYEQPPSFPLTVQAETMEGTGNQVQDGRQLIAPDNWYIFQTINFPQAGWLQVEVIARAEWDVNGAWPRLEVKLSGSSTQEINSTEWQSYFYTTQLSQAMETWFEILLDEGTRQTTPVHSVIVDKAIISYYEPQPVLYVNPITLDFGDTETKLTFDISNVGDGTLQWNVATSNSWITSLSPTSGQDGGTITVNIDRAGLPLGAHQGIVAVTSNGGNLDVTNNMTVTQLIPVISSFAPTSGLVGTEVTITGSNFVNVSEVAFNGFSTPIFSIDSDTQIRAEVPLGASSGKITVTTSGGTATSENDFNVTVETVVVFADNFNRADIGPDWQIEQPGGSVTIINYPPDGKLELSAGSGVNTFLTTEGTQLVDAILAFDFDNGPETRENNGTYIYLRYVDSDNFYYLDIAEDNYAAPSRQKITLRKIAAGVGQEIYYLDQTLLDPGRYEFSAIGNQISFRNISGGTNINFSVTDDGISSAGKVGFYVNEETTTFDNVMMSKPLSIIDIETLTSTGTYYFNETAEGGDGHGLDMIFNSLTESGEVTVQQFSIAPSNPPWDNACDFYLNVIIDGGITAFSVDVVFHYTDSDVSGIDENDLHLYTSETSDSWAFTPNQILNTVENTITVPGITEFSYFSMAPSRTVTNLSPEKINTNLQLSWTSVSGASSYNIYRDPSPYFAPDRSGGVNRVATDLNETNWTDTGATGDVGINYYYVATAVSATGTEGENSNRVGEFDFPLVPGASQTSFKYNDLCMVFNDAAITDANELVNHIGGVYAIYKWDASSQSWLYWLPDYSLGTNFTVETGHTYLLSLKDSTPDVVTFTGGVPEQGTVVFALVPGTSETSFKYNYISLPLGLSGITNADELANDIGGVYSIYKWDAPNQSWLYWLPDYSLGTNFAVQAGYPYLMSLKSSAPTTWPNYSQQELNGTVNQKILSKDAFTQKKMTMPLPIRLKKPVK